MPLKPLTELKFDEQVRDRLGLIIGVTLTTFAIIAGYETLVGDWIETGGLMNSNQSTGTKGVPELLAEIEPHDATGPESMQPSTSPVPAETAPVDSPPKTAKEQVQMKALPHNEAVARLFDGTVSAIRQQRLNRARGATEAFVLQGEQARNDALKLQQTRSEFDTRMAELLDSNDGRRIAANDGYMTTYQELKTTSLPQGRDADAYRLQLERLMIVPRERLSNQTESLFEPSDSDLSTLESLREKIRADIAEFNAPTATLNTMTAIDRPQSSVSLREALNQRHSSQTLALAQQLEEQRAESHKEKLRLLEEEHKRERQEMRRKIPLIAKARSPEVQRCLALFLAKGYYQPGDRGHVPNDRSLSPFSYAKIQGSGAFDNINKLSDISTSHLDDARRQYQSGFPGRKFTRDQIETLKKTQQYLIELGPILVELKMLAP